MPSQMVLPAWSAGGSDARSLYGLRNIGVNIVELGLAQVHVHAAQGVDHLGHCLPVKGAVIVDLQVQVPVQALMACSAPPRK